nr:secretoglobin family 1D member 4-like [Dasypus novemcinctus]
MRLGILFLLVTLALCCYQANAVGCPSILNELIILLMGNEDVYKILLESYTPPLEVIEDKTEVKKCIDQISGQYKCRLVTIEWAQVMDTHILLLSS